MIPRNEHELAVMQMDAKLDGEVAKFDQQFPVERIRKALEDAFEWRLEEAKKWHDRLFERYNLAAKQGIPFKEREALVDWGRVKMVERGTIWLTAVRKDYKVEPTATWMTHGVYEILKKKGLREYAKQYLSEMISTPVKYPETSQGVKAW